MANAVHRVQKVNNPTLRGEPLLLLPVGLLVRWPERVPTPEIGEWIMAAAVSVPAHLHEPVLTFLFSTCALDRCDAAKQIADNRGQRQRILHRFFGESLVQKMITTSERMTPELRAHIHALGDDVPLRTVIRVAYGLTCKGRDRRQPNHTQARQKCE